jgi:hypothetical protein
MIVVCGLMAMLHALLFMHGWPHAAPAVPVTRVRTGLVANSINTMGDCQGPLLALATARVIGISVDHPKCTAACSPRRHR